MRIKNLKINGFGKLKDKEINLENGINVIYGKNEAGKSTLLKYITSMFYGLSKNKNGGTIPEVEKYEPWNNEEFSGKISYELDQDKIDEEAKYDGFYAVITNLEDNVEEILRINKQRWEIEENFRIMKTDLEARPVYVRRDDRIKAHFLTCYISLLVYRLLEKKLNNKYTCEEILSTRRQMQVTLLSGNSGYVPSYKRTELTDLLHDTFEFRTDYEFITKSSMRNIIKNTKTSTTHKK